ncbi:major capsid protein [Nocardia asteroides]|uniref:major capsid protein n=1 Tax=Nocardia asteroides TaxID=1824 RepID=UPI0033C55F07
MANTPYTPEFPLGVPSVSGNSITVDLMLKEPTRINRYISDIALQKFFADRIFATGGGVSGGALLYTQLTTNDLYATRDVQEIAPGAEFPELTFDRPEPKVATVKKIGGRFRVTDEARDRNDLSVIQNEGTKVGNNITRTIHARAIQALSDSVTAIGSDVQITGVSWADAAGLTLTTTANNIQPAADFAKASLKAETFELGGEFNLWIVNPQEMTNFQITYGDRWRDVLTNNGVDMIASNRVTAGEAWVVQERMVGEMRFEQALKTVTYRDDSTESEWVQTSIRPVFAVTNPYAVLKVTGLAA